MGVDAQKSQRFVTDLIALVAGACVYDAAHGPSPDRYRALHDRVREMVSEEYKRRAAEDIGPLLRAAMDAARPEGAA